MVEGCINGKLSPIHYVIQVSTSTFVAPGIELGCYWTNGEKRTCLCSEEAVPGITKIKHRRKSYCSRYLISSKQPDLAIMIGDLVNKRAFATRKREVLAQ